MICKLHSVSIHYLYVAILLAVFALCQGCHPRGPSTVLSGSVPVNQAGSRYLNLPAMPVGFQSWFEDKAVSLGIDVKMGHNGKTPLTVLEEMGPGCAVCDFNGDGHADVLILGQAGPVGNGLCHLYRNNGNGTFTDVTKGSGLEAPGNYMGCAVADIDNDGMPDIVITGYGVVKLFKNLGGCKFQDISKGSGIEAKSPTEWSSGAAFADVDHDGLVDLYVGKYIVFNSTTIQFCNYSPYKASCGPIFYDPQIGTMYKNLGNGKFKDVTKQMGLDSAHGKTLGVAFYDINGDGWPDLYLGNDEMPGDMFINNHGKNFVNKGVEAGVGLSGGGKMQGAMGVDFGDIDHDGRPDLFVSTYEFETKALYFNGDNTLFTNVSEKVGLGPAMWNFVGFGTKFVDIDNSGWLDLVVANGHIHDNQDLIDKMGAYRQPCLLFMNEQGKSFTNRTMEAGPGFTTPAVGRGLAIGDLNDDGLQDVVITDIEGNVRVLMNRHNVGNNWLRVSLVGTHCNRMGIGAKITVKSGAEKWSAEVTTGGSYFSASDPRIHFGLGKATKVDSIEVKWPCGKISVLNNPRISGDLIVTEQ